MWSSSAAEAAGQGGIMCPAARSHSVKKRNGH